MLCMGTSTCIHSYVYSGAGLNYGLAGPHWAPGAALYFHWLWAISITLLCVWATELYNRVATHPLVLLPCPQSPSLFHPIGVAACSGRTIVTMVTPTTCNPSCVPFDPGPLLPVQRCGLRLDRVGQLDVHDHVHCAFRHEVRSTAYPSYLKLLKTLINLVFCLPFFVDGCAFYYRFFNDEQSQAESDAGLWGHRHHIYSVSKRSRCRQDRQHVPAIRTLGEFTRSTQSS